MWSPRAGPPRSGNTSTDEPGKVPGRKGWRSLIVAGLVGLTFARWLWVLDDHGAVVAVAPADPPPAWRHLNAPANVAVIATVVLVGPRCRDLLSAPSIRWTRCGSPLKAA